jgi:nicotinamide-nucleotide amidase
VIEVTPELSRSARAVARLLAERGETLAVAESSAGGLISASLLSVPGASAFYLGGAVIYTLAASKALLAPAVEMPTNIRGASDPFARYLAQAIALRLGASWGLAETGATGPAGNRYGDPAGHAWVAVNGDKGEDQDSLHVLTGSDDREANMVAFAAAALGLLQRSLTA